MEFFDSKANKIFFGNTDRLPEWVDGNEQSKAIDRVRMMLKNYLELDNVSFLFGSGSSIHLGAVTIRNFPLEIENYVKEQDVKQERTGIWAQFIETIEQLQAVSVEKIEDWEKKNKNEKFKRIKSSGEIASEFERILNFLIAKNYILEEDKSTDRTDKISELIVCIKEGLFSVCDIDNSERRVPQWLIENKRNSSYEVERKQGELLEKETKYIFHEKFIKALLQRPLNLRRANIFTANYDLAFEYAFDRLGVHYIDGFAGFHKRFFKPETFEYDIFYPGSTTAGKVQRIEKVLRYFKLHGSLSWINSDKRDSTNLYGIEEMTLPLIDKQMKKGEIIVYPTAVKKSYTLDLPYSELFRQFASTITQSQSLLVTVGYAFADEHFNDIIFQALSNPTFTLLIVDFHGVNNNPNLERIKNLNDSRIVILQGPFFGDFLTFADTLMPNFNNVEYGGKIADTLNGYFNDYTPKS